MQDRDQIPFQPQGHGRMLLAFAVFVAAVGGGAWALGHMPHKVPDTALATAKAKPQADEPLFYQTIGQAPDSNEPSLPDDADTSDQAAPGAKVSYTLELKVTSKRAEAEALIDELHDRGIEAYYTPLTRGGKVVYRVRRGIYSNQKEASQAAVELAAAGKLPAKVVKLQ
jgi:septal ring-binding cell division protein DamX